MQVFAIVIALVSAQNVVSGAYLRRGLITPLLESVPFSVDVKIGKGSDAMDVEPTPKDYSAVSSAVASWFDLNSQDFYSNSSDFQYVETTCEMKDDNLTSSNTNNVTAFVSDDQYQHKVSLGCEAKFDTMGKNETSGIPSPLTLVLNAVDAYPMVDFISGYFTPAMASGSAFEAARRVSLALMYSYTEATTTTTTSNTTTGTVPDTTMAPSSTDNAGSTAAPGGSTEGASDEVTIPLVLQWTIGAPNGEPLRKPTEEEFTAFVSDTQAFVTQALTDAFNIGDTNNVLPDFVSLDSTVRSKTYDESSPTEAHIIVVESVATFQLTPGTDTPPMWQWVGAMRNAGLELFRTSYLAEQPGIFQNPTSVSWKAIED